MYIGQVLPLNIRSYMAAQTHILLTWTRGVRLSAAWGLLRELIHAQSCLPALLPLPFTPTLLLLLAGSPLIAVRGLWLTVSQTAYVESLVVVVRGVFHYWSNYQSQLVATIGWFPEGGMLCALHAQEDFRRIHIVTFQLRVPPCGDNGRTRRAVNRTSVASPSWSFAGNPSTTKHDM